MPRNRVKMVERFQYFHNPEEKICVAVCPKDLLREIYYEELEALGGFLKKRLGNKDSINAEFGVNLPLENMPKLSARATCSDEEEYSYEIGEKLAGERLKFKILDKLYGHFYDFVDYLQDFTDIVSDYTDKVLCDRVWKQSDRLEAYKIALKEYEE